MSRSPPEAPRILELYHAARDGLPPIRDVAVRPNVRRLASVSQRATGAAVLNLSSAVIDAGEEAWRLIAPALEGDRAALARIRELTREGVAANRRQRQTTRNRRRPTTTERPTLPDTPCQGTPTQQEHLRTLVTFVRETSGWAGALPSSIQLRVSRRMTRALGSCAIAGDRFRITIAERLFRRGLEDVRLDTVRHELAHLATYRSHPSGRIRPHGPEWREWARRLGARPERLCTVEEGDRVAAASTHSNARPLVVPPEVARWRERRGER